MKESLVLPCIRAVMGDWVFYSSVMSLEQISSRVITDKKYRENPELDRILQRDLKERKKDIAKYLLNDEHRFFNSIIIGVFGGLPEWHEFSIEAKVFELKNGGDEDIASVGLLKFLGDEEMFAIDGQHRVAGMQIAFKEELAKKQEDKVLSDDKFPVIIVAHIDDELGRKRTRKLFSDINKKAKPVPEGDKIKIDEEDICAITTRRIYANYPLFENGALISLTEQETLGRGDIDHFTNLLGLNNVNKELKKLWQKSKATNPYDEVNVEKFYQISWDFFEIVIHNIPELRQFFLEKTITIAELRQQNKYLLFRPIGLKLMAKLYAYFIKKYDNPDIFLEKINLISFVMPESPLNNILWNNGKMEAGAANQTFAFSLCLYLLEEITDSKAISDLLEKYRKIMKNPAIDLPNRLV